MSLKSKFLYQVSVSLLYSIIPVITFPYVSRVLGPENIGKINFIDYASQFLILLASFGIPYYGVREIAKGRKNPKQTSAIASELALIHIIITLASLFLFAILIFFQPKEFADRGLIILAFVNILTNAFGLEWMIHGMEDFKFLAKRSFIIKIASLAAILIFVQTSSDYIGYYAILIASNVLILATDIGYVFKKGIGFIKPAGIKKHIKPLSVFFLTTISLSIYTFFDTVILGIISGSLAVGFYTTALKIIRISQNMINDAGSVILPRISFLIGEGNKEEISRITNKSLTYILTTTIPFGVFLFLTSGEIIMVLAGEKFIPSADVLKMLSVLPLILGLANLFFIQILLPHEKEKIILAGVAIGSVVSIVSNLILCPLYQEKGAALSCITAEFVIAVFLGIYSVQHVRFRLSVRSITGTILTAMSFIPLVYLCRTLSNNSFIVLLMEGLFCLAAFIFIQLLAGNIIVKESFHFFFRGFKKSIAISDDEKKIEV